MLRHGKGLTCWGITSQKLRAKNIPLSTLKYASSSLTFSVKLAIAGQGPCAVGNPKGSHPVEHSSFRCVNARPPLRFL